MEFSEMIYAVDRSCESDGDVFIVVTPSAYFEKHGAVDDQSLCGEELAEIGFVDAMESSYEYERGTVEDGTALLESKGVVFSQDLQDFIDDLYASEESEEYGEKDDY